MAEPALTPPPRLRPRRARVRALLALAAGVALAHAWLVDELGERMAQASRSAPPARLEAVYARQIVPQAPVVTPAAAPPAPAPAARRPRAVTPVAPVAPAASRPQPEPDPGPIPEPTPEPAPEPLPQPLPQPSPEPAFPLAAASAPEPEAGVSGAQADAITQAAGASGPPAFVWPPSTRMRYVLTGNYRGEVHGSAQVEWIKAGDRYQVHLDVVIGPSFAPLLTRRMSSDGLITPDGLVPQRYDEITRTGLRTRQATVRLTPQGVTLANGTEVPAQAGVQDTASQFVQLTQRFMREPGLLQPGQSLSFPLALPRHMNPWVYEVQAAERLATPFGEVEVFPLKPRRPDKPTRDLRVEIWYAPALQYLPARILIRQDDATFVDLMIEKLPEQAQAEGQATRGEAGASRSGAGQEPVSKGPGSGP